MSRQKHLFMALVIFVIINQIFSQIQYGIYQKLDNQVILQYYQGTNPSYWLLVVQNQTLTVLKRVHFNRNSQKTLVQQFYFDQGEFVLKDFERHIFKFVLIAVNNQTTYQLYYIGNSTHHQYSDNNYDYDYYQYSQFSIQLICQLQDKFIPLQGNLSKIQLSSTGDRILINQQIIQSCNRTVDNIGWKYILAIDQQFQIFLSQNGIYLMNQVAINKVFSKPTSYKKIYNYQISQKFNCEIKVYRIKLQDSINLNYFESRILAFCYKKINQSTFGYDWLLISYFISSQYQNGTLIKNMTGQTSQIPKFKTTQHIQKFIITGYYINKTYMFILVVIDYVDLIFLDARVPSKIKDHEMDIQINDWHLFARNLTPYQQNYNTLFYLIINQQLILINQSSIDSSKSSSLVSTFIIYRPYNSGFKDIYDKKPTLLLYYKNQTTYSYSLIQFESLINIEQEFIKFKDYEVSNSTLKSTIELKSLMKNIYQARWVYNQKSQNQNTITFFLQSFFLNITVNFTIQGLFSLLSLSNGEYNCILAKSDNLQQNLLLSLLFDPIQKKIYMLDLYDYSDLTINIQNIFSIQVAQKCEVIYLTSYFNQKKLLRKRNDSQNSPIYEEQLFDNNILAFDQSKKYFIWSQFLGDSQLKFCFMNQSNIIISKIDLFYQKKNLIKIDNTQTRIVILTFRKIAVINTIWQNTIIYECKLIIFQKNQQIWTLIYQGDNKQITYVNGQFLFKISPNLQFVAIQYYQFGLKVFRFDYKTKNLIDLSNKSKQLQKLSLLDKKTNIYCQISNQFLYVRDQQYQYVFKFSSQTQIQIVLKNGIDILYYQQNKEKVIISDYQQEEIDSYSQIQINYIISDHYYNQQMYNFKDTIHVRRKSNDIYSQSIQTDTNGIIYDKKNDKLRQCSPGCQYCFSIKNCRKCYDGYYLFHYDAYKNNKQCLKCNENCKTCKKDQPNVCLSCFSNYVLVGNICKKCHSVCLQCTINSQNKCLSCQFGKSLLVLSHKNKTCIQCSPNCLYCQKESQCIQCDIGFTVANGLCIMCPFSCNKCNSSALIHCLQCKLGFYPEKSTNPYENITCKRCSDNCKLCKSQTFCLQCQNFYILKTINVTSQNNDNSTSFLPQSRIICAIKCVLPCKDCSQTNSTECLSCIQGYIYDKTSKQCMPDLTCNQFLNCVSCPHNYNLMINKCHLCQTDIKCNRCHQYNLSICLSCAKGYFLNDNQCFKCSTQCQECIVLDVCTKCTPGYILPLDSTTSKCLSCSSNCKTCEYTPANCLSCNQNMQLHGSRCISNVSVNFNITLDYDYKSFSSADFEGISNQISLKTGKPRQKVIITSVKPGSVNLFGSILVQNQQDQTKVLKIVRTEFAQGSTINDKKITSSSYSGAFVEPLQMSNSSVNIKLILSIVLPVSVIIITFIICIVLKVRRLNRQLQDKNQTDEQSTQSGASMAIRQERRKQRAAKRNKRNLPQTQKITSIMSSTTLGITTKQLNP